MILAHLLLFVLIVLLAYHCLLTRDLVGVSKANERHLDSLNHHLSGIAMSLSGVTPAIEAGNAELTVQGGQLWDILSLLAQDGGIIDEVASYSLEDLDDLDEEPPTRGNSPYQRMIEELTEKLGPNSFIAIRNPNGEESTIKPKVTNADVLEHVANANDLFYHSLRTAKAEARDAVVIEPKLTELNIAPTVARDAYWRALQTAQAEARKAQDAAMIADKAFEDNSWRKSDLKLEVDGRVWVKTDTEGLREEDKVLVDPYMPYDGIEGKPKTVDLEDVLGVGPLDEDVITSLNAEALPAEMNVSNGALPMDYEEVYGVGIVEKPHVLRDDEEIPTRTVIGTDEVSDEYQDGREDPYLEGQDNPITAREWLERQGIPWSHDKVADQPRIVREP